MAHLSLRSLGLLAVLLTLAVPSAAHAVTATVRIEGQSSTLLPRTTVTLPDSGTFKTADGATCALNSVAGAIDAAVGSSGWDRMSFTSTILGETHQFANSDYWAEWVSEKFGGGICTDIVRPGDRVLMLVDVSPPPDYSPTVFPLAITGAPSAVTAGQPFTVTVTEYRTTGTIGTGTPTPADGVTVTAGPASATTGATGQATLTLPDAGTFAIRATRGTAGRSEPVTVTASAPAGGSSTETAPSPVAAPPGPDVAPSEADSAGNPVRADDTTPPGALVAGIAEGRRFAHGRGPRVLRGSAGQAAAGSGLLGPDPSGVRLVELRLTRRVGQRCAYYSGRSERLRAARCGATHGSWFAAGTATPWSYLLPFRLPRGRWVLDVRATDGAGNRDDQRRRGQNRIVFVVD